MALIKCPECNKDVSDKISACPHCGYPLNSKPVASQTTNANSEIAPPNYTARRIFAAIVFIVLFILCIIGFRMPDDSPKYKCKYCGFEMESYWSYHDGYVCYSCDKKYFRNK